MPTDIEKLLSRIGSEPVPADCRHYYALRRALLNSRYFESHRRVEAVAGWVGFASVAFAGGIVAVALVMATRQAVLREREQPAVPFARAMSAPAPELAWVPLPAFDGMAERLMLTVAR